VKFERKKIRRIIDKLEIRLSRIRKVGKSEFQKTGNAGEESNVIPIDRVARRRKKRKKKDKKKGGKPARRARKAGKKLSTEKQMERELREAVVSIEKLMMLTLNDMAEFRISFKVSSTSEKIYEKLLIKRKEELIDYYGKILSGLKEKNIDILEKSFENIKMKRKAIDHIEILNRKEKEPTSELAKLKELILDFIDCPGKPDRIRSHIKSAEMYIDNMDRSNRNEFKGIKNPEPRVKEMFEDFNALVREFRRGIEIVESSLKKYDKEEKSEDREMKRKRTIKDIICGLLMIKSANDGIEEMLGGKD